MAMLLNYDKDNLPNSTYRKVKNAVNADPETFTIKKANMTSMAAGTLMDWIFAILVYHEINTEIRQLNAQQSSIDDAL